MEIKSNIITGECNKAKIFIDNYDNATEKQIKEMLDNPFVIGSKIRIMPDCHAGKGSVVGFTMDYSNAKNNCIVPSIVGVDIGCGMLTVELPSNIDYNTELFNKLDKGILNKNIVPLGFGIRSKEHKKAMQFESKLKELKCYNSLENKERIMKSLGSLGGGNHFIEIAKSKNNGKHYLIIHTGSRNLGLQVANFYKLLAVEKHNLKIQTEKESIIKHMTKTGNTINIQNELDKIKSISNTNLIPLNSENEEDYLHDMNIAQEYAKLNREIIAEELIKFLFGKVELNSFHTIHNYIDIENKIIRKGSISAKENEIVLIPLNMRDGSILAKGKGNTEWNQSAPHGAGRILSRGQAKREVDLETFVNSMEGIHSVTVSSDTLDESPMAYKDKDIIIEAIKDTVNVLDILVPVYNIKG